MTKSLKLIRSLENESQLNEIKGVSGELFDKTAQLGADLAQQIVNTAEQLTPRNPEWAVDLILDRMKEALNQHGLGGRIGIEQTKRNR